MIYFTSDPHYGHINILKYCPNRKFDNIEDMNETLIKNYNEAVKPEDTCIFVGDIFFRCPKSKAKAIMRRLNGKKILVLGNHDQSMTQMMRLGFDLACYSMSIRIDGQKVDIKHYPFKPKWWERLFMKAKFKDLKYDLRYLDRRPIDKGQFLIHGHIHSTEKFRGRQIHVGVDAWDMKPVSIEQIKKYIQKNK